MINYSTGFSDNYCKLNQEYFSHFYLKLKSELQEYNVSISQNYATFKIKTIYTTSAIK